MSPARIDVQSAQRTYPVFVGRGVLTDLAAYLRDAGLKDPVIVTVPPVWRRHADRFAALGLGDPIIMADGERAKTPQTVAKLYDAFASRRVARTSTIIAVGGGVAGDTAGFAAATYLRGLAFVQVATTLLAQVDSAIGGKVGVNLPAGKNLAGAFHAPSLVVCDTETLTTLPRRELRAGLYEVVKYGAIASAPLFDRVSANLKRIMARDHDTLVSVISDCCRIKADIVSRDERESGPRRVLNFGHTVGHALEAITQYKRFRHGEAIAYGMQAAASLSAARGLMPAGDQARLADLIHRMGPLPPVADRSCAAALEAMGHDTKIADGRLHFVLSAGLGATQIVADVSAAELTDAMQSLGLS